MTFTCGAAEYGVIAEPQPAKQVLQDWYRKLPAIDPEHRTVFDMAKTVKTCMPFLDALGLGFILPVPVDFSLEVMGNGTQIQSYYRYPREGILSQHNDYQIKGHPRANQPVLKVLTLWEITTPPGWSCLVVPPLNRPGLPLEAASGVIDTDVLHTHIVIPCFINLPDGLHDIAKGTPLAQVIPFTRNEIAMVARAGTAAEYETASKQAALVLSEGAAYRKHLRAKERG